MNRYLIGNMMKKKKVLVVCGSMLSCVLIYVVLTFLLDLLCGDSVENYDWIGVAFSGVVFAVLMYLFRLYEEKKLKE